MQFSKLFPYNFSQTSIFKLDRQTFKSQVALKTSYQNMYSFHGLSVGMQDLYAEFDKCVLFLHDTYTHCTHAVHILVRVEQPYCFQRGALPYLCAEIIRALLSRAQQRKKKYTSAKKQLYKQYEIEIVRVLLLQRESFCTTNIYVIYQILVNELKEK